MKEKFSHLNITSPFTYGSYKEFIIDLAETGSCTGEITEERVSATKINAPWIKKIDEQISVRDDIKKMLESLKTKWNWILIVESWCGDSAQIVPLIAKIAEQSENIDFKIVLRDNNPEFMDAHLTNGSRSIPKLICVDAETAREIGTWGPRSLKIQKMIKEFKATNPDLSHDDFLNNLHFLYAQDKGESVQKEFSELLKEWMNK